MKIRILELPTPYETRLHVSHGFLARKAVNLSWIDKLRQRAHTNGSDHINEATIGLKCMEPTLYEGDKILFREVQYLGGLLDPPYPKLGDMVIFWHPVSREAKIKRIIALQGDSLGIKNSEVVKNGILLKEDYVRISCAIADMNEIIIPKRTVFVMGDNRSNIDDSRKFGPLDIRMIFGIVIKILPKQAG